MIYLLQLLVLLSAYFLGRHDAPACDHFKEEGSSAKEQHTFHGYGFATRLVTILIACLPLWGTPLLLLVLTIIVMICLVWPAFNIGVNLGRRHPRRPWHYLSTAINGARADKLLLELLGPNAGKLYVYIAAGLVVLLNILILIIYGNTDSDCFRLV